MRGQEYPGAVGQDFPEGAIERGVAARAGEADHAATDGLRASTAN